MPPKQINIKKPAKALNAAQKAAWLSVKGVIDIIRDKKDYVRGSESVGSVHEMQRSVGITRSEEFKKKGLAQYAVNTGIRCGHQCLYCSTNSVLGRHDYFKKHDKNHSHFGYAIVDPGTPGRVARDASRITDPGLLELSTTSDAWAPESKARNLGRKCLKEILSQTGWEVRILTKNVSVSDDFQWINEHYRDRVCVGLSLTGTREKEAILAAVELNASPISKRMETIEQAHKLGLRTYGMLCPLLPGIADDRETIEKLVRFCLKNGAEEIFAEAVNRRGNGLFLCAMALKEAGYKKESKAVDAIRNAAKWSEYATKLLKTLQDVMKEQNALPKLRYLLYINDLQSKELEAIKKNAEGVIWLGKKTKRGRRGKKQTPND